MLPSHGCLHSWAKQGVLLINSVLTVEKSAPGSHRGKGWEVFTDAIITLLNDEHKDLVFLLWGSYARKKAVLIDRQRHMVLEPLIHHHFRLTEVFMDANIFLDAIRT